MSFEDNPRVMEQIVHDEQEARLRLEEARAQAHDDAPPEHHELIHKLEAEWNHALERLHLARKDAEHDETEG